jgi:vacuolar-type H+-ATPase subunit I/STV1
MPHEKLGLPSTFANLFFRHLSSGDDDEEMTAEMIDEDIAALEEQIADKKALREALLAELAKKAQAQAAKAAEQAAVAELEKAAVEAARKLAEAKAKLAALQA